MKLYTLIALAGTLAAQHGGVVASMPTTRTFVKSCDVVQPAALLTVAKAGWGSISSTRSDSGTLVVSFAGQKSLRFARGELGCGVAIDIGGTRTDGQIESKLLGEIAVLLK